MAAPALSIPSGNLCNDMQGVWWLEAREDYNKDGERRIDPILGIKSTGILSYAKNYFAAQFMKTNRTDNESVPAIHSGQNNTSAVGGYDAYFGTFSVNETTGKVLHTVLGSITPANVGMIVSRDLRVNDNQLVIQLDTTTPEGEFITRTLTLKRVS